MLHRAVQMRIKIFQKKIVVLTMKVGIGLLLPGLDYIFPWISLISVFHAFSDGTHKINQNVLFFR